MLDGKRPTQPLLASCGLAPFNECSENDGSCGEMGRTDPAARNAGLVMAYGFVFSSCRQREKSKGEEGIP